jgi:FkbM family methyltransferase
VAIEANPRLVAYLLGNLAENRVTNVDVRWCALGEERGATAVTDLVADDRNGVSADGTGLSVPQCTLDDVTFGIPHIDLLKIDVEGYELFVLRGGMESLARTTCVHFESCERLARAWGHSANECVQLLQTSGFDIFRLVGRRSLERIAAASLSDKVENLVALRRSTAPRPGFGLLDV